MIRPFTTVCMMLAAGSMLYVYQTKHQGQLLDKEIARTLKATDAVRERMVVLQAEWSQMNEPARLSELSRQYLNLATTPQGQLATLSDLASRLPAPLPPGSNPAPADDPVVAAAPAMAGAVAVAAASMGSGAQSVARPAALAHAAPAPAAQPASRPVQLAALPTPPAALPAPPAAPTAAPSAATPRPVAKAAVRAPAERPLPEPPAERAVAERAPPPAPRAVALAEAVPPVPPRPHILAPVVTVLAPPIPAPQPPRHVAVQPAVAPHPTPAAAGPMVPAVMQAAAVSQGYGSVLGGVRPAALPAPVPYTQASR